VCGLAGWLGGPQEPAAATIAREMCRAIAHRGPEGDGTSLLTAPGDVHGCLGHRRLKIRDLSEAAHQPMASADASVQLVFNGEIYNFVELRRELGAAGHRFASTGDTEVVLRAYEQWGEAFVEHIDGMFAIAVWDAKRGTLLLVRDRIGKKPLYCVHQRGRVTFASEIKALAGAPWVSLVPNHGVFPAFLTFGYAPSPLTMYQGVRQVAPGTLLRFDAREDRLTERSYWSALPSGVPLAADESLFAAIRERVEEAVRRRLISDVPVGALLSGGIDSSLVVTLMQRNTDHRVETFTVGFPDAPTYDESAHARRIAERLDTAHTELAVQVDASDLLDRLVWLHDGPFGDSSAVPTYLVCAAARSRVTVVLTGDGGDEVFAGYQRFSAAALARLVPAEVLGPLRFLSRCLPDGGGYFNARSRLERFASIDGPIERRYLGWISIFDQASRAALIGSPSVDGAESFLAEYARAGLLPPIDRLIHGNLRTYLPDDLAVKIDRASMAHSIEARSPLLDTAVIELMNRVPAREKVGFRQVKPVLRRAFEPLLPEATWRRAKHGFGAPVDDWFSGSLGDRYADEVLGRDGRLGDVLAKPELARLWHEHRAGTARHGARLWTLITMERWLRDIARPKPFEEPTEPAIAATVV
jgi:asparagine synthase (glutamine-hydrolysing)